MKTGDVQVKLADVIFEAHAGGKEVTLNVGVTNLDIEDIYFCSMCDQIHIQINQQQCIVYMNRRD